MLSKSQISLLTSLQHKKFRLEHGLFLVEGYKSVIEFVDSPYQIHTVFHTPAFDPKVLKLSRKINFQEISVAELEKITNLKSPREIIASVTIPELADINHELLKGQFTLVLDGLQDPGNMGTIIRTADWFGIRTIICSDDAVDIYNPKVVQAAMGSLARMQVHYLDLCQVLTDARLPVFGAMLEGESIFTSNFGHEGLIVMGHEGKGLRKEVEQLITKKITIPRFGKAESLNVAIAAALFCAEVNRKTNK